MAEVFRAHDPEMGRDLAIKILNERYSADDNFRLRFLRESRAAGVMSHPNIVTMYDVGEVEGRPFIAMELLDGASLDEHMRGGRKFSVKESVELAIQLAEALDYAHSKGIIHRDIKPSNLILLADDRTLKIADFGIARIEAPDVTSHTQTADVLGTPQYMSPEQVLGKKIDGRADLFSVGIVLYQMLCGEKPFIAETLGTLLFRIASEPPRPLREVKPGLPAALYAIVDRLLAKDPKDRYETGAALGKALRAAMTQSPKQAVPKGSSQSMMWGALAGAVFVIAGTGVWYLTSESASGPTLQTVRQDKSPSVETPAAAVTPSVAMPEMQNTESMSAQTSVKETVSADVTPVKKEVAASPSPEPTGKVSTPAQATRTSPAAAATVPVTSDPKESVRSNARSIPPPAPIVKSPTPVVQTAAPPPPPVVQTAPPPPPAVTATKASVQTTAPATSEPVVSRPAPTPAKADPAESMSLTQAKQQLRDGSITKDEYRSLVDRIKQRYRDDVAALKDKLRSGEIDKRAYKEKMAELQRGYE